MEYNHSFLVYKIIRAGTIITKREVSYTEQFMDQCRQKPKIQPEISLLSGGNQQKVMLLDG